VVPLTCDSVVTTHFCSRCYNLQVLRNSLAQRIQLVFCTYELVEPQQQLVPLLGRQERGIAKRSQNAPQPLHTAKYSRTHDEPILLVEVFRPIDRILLAHTPFNDKAYNNY
jgi:hypothetical protein